MNIILIIFDSLRADCIEYLGSPPWGKVYTPNLNKFAKESYLLNRCYPEALPTLPARRAIYTGQRVYPFTSEERRLKGDFYGAPGWGPILEDQFTISEILRANGYITALISDVQHMFKPSKNFHRGFDEWLWVRGYETDHFKSGPIPEEDEINYWLPIILQNELNVEFMKQCLMNLDNIRSEEDYFVAKIFREAAKWLERNTSVNNKFLLIESWAPHEPWFIPKYYKEIYSNKNYDEQVLSLYTDITNLPPELLESTQANYSGLVTMCDRWFGYFIDAVSNMGMLDDTLIVVTSDHGHTIGENNYLGKRGYPSSPEVFNIPILLRHPDYKLESGKKSNILVQHTDIPATILDMVGVSLETQAYRYKWEEDVGTMKSIERDISKKFIRMHGNSFKNALIEGGNNFRDYIVTAWGPNITVVTDNWWFNCKINGKGFILHDLKVRNPFKKNVANSNPKVVKELFDLIIKEAGGDIPNYLIKMAESIDDVPGCSDLAL